MRLAKATDYALLLHWRNHGDPAAFAALVDRHAAMVHTACLRVVRNRSLAQEVAQDTFLKLTQLERFDGESLGGWLHRVATHRALDIAKAESRRQTRETAFEESRVPVADPAGRAAAVLDEIDAALATLPDELRDPIVLHYLEGRTHRDIARSLRVSRATITRRIHRGLDQLREQLGARGVTAGVVGILAVLESAHSDPVPPDLTVSLRKLALAQTTNAPAPSPAAWRSGSPLAITGAVLVTLAALVSVIAFRGNPLRETPSVAATTPPRVPSIPARAPSSAIGPSSTATDISVATENVPAAVIHGEVFDASGNAIPNARVVLFHNANDWGFNDRVVEETRSDENGRFAFPAAPVYLLERAGAAERDVYTVFATHAGHALGWANLRRGAEYDAIAITLLNPQGGSILVVDHLNDTPIAGARVWPYALGGPYETVPGYRDRVFLQSDPAVLGATTNSDGIAFLTDLPAAALDFRVTMPGYATGYAFQEGRTVRLTRGARLTGRITDESGTPVAGATIQLGALYWMHLYFKTISDRNGEFAFHDLPASGWDMSAWGEGKSGTGAYTVTVSGIDAWVPGTFRGLAPGETAHLELKAQPGVRVRCRVVTEVTRKPVPGALVQLYRSSFSDDPLGYTDDNGEAVLVTAPGDVHAIVRAPPEGTYWSRDAWQDWLPDIARAPKFVVQGTETTLLLTCPELAGRLVTITGSIILPQGTAASEIRVCVSSQAGLTLPGRSQRDAFSEGASIDANGAFTVDGVPEGVRIHVYANTRDQRYGGVATFVIPAGSSPSPIRPVALLLAETIDYVIETDTLERTLKRKLDVRLLLDGETLRCGASDREVTADANGVFHIPNVLPGHTYQLIDRAPANDDAEKPFDSSVVLLP